jgi:Cu/Ag efflux protein CusF
MKRLILVLLAGAVLAAPGVAKASGVVLKVDRASKLVAVTRTANRVALVHTGARVHVGQRVAMNARALRNGTFAATGVHVVGRTKHVRFRGMLLARSHGRLVVSAGGAVISLRSAKRTTSSAGDSGPQPGSQVEVEAQVENDELETEDVTVVAPAAPGGSIEGHLTAIGTGTVTVTSEDMSLVLKVPAGIDLTKFKTGDEVLATFTQGPDGSLTLTQLAGDENAQEADDQGEIENGDDDGDNGDNGGSGGGDE